MTQEERKDMTRTLWTLIEIIREEETDAAKADNDDEIVKEVRYIVSQIEAALAKMDKKEADTFKERILSGEVFKGIYYGEVLNLTDDEEKACNSFLNNFQLDK